MNCNQESAIREEALDRIDVHLAALILNHDLTFVLCVFGFVFSSPRVLLS